MAVGHYDANIRDALLWWMHRCRFMRATAALRGYDPDKVVPKNKWVMGVKVSGTPGLIEAKFPNPKQGPKAYKFDVVATYTQLKNLMGQTAFDRYLLGADSQRWDLPKKKEKEFEKEKNRKNKNKESEETGLRDDSVPASAEQILPAEEEEEDEEEEMDETSRAAVEAEKDLQKEREEMNTD